MRRQEASGNRPGGKAMWQAAHSCQHIGLFKGRAFPWQNVLAILFKLFIDSTFHAISVQRLKIVDEARLKQKNPQARAQTRQPVGG
jgi:hypothetical protein